jgi:hypothetical protein
MTAPAHATPPAARPRRPRVTATVLPGQGAPAPRRVDRALRDHLIAAAFAEYQDREDAGIELVLSAVHLVAEARDLEQLADAVVRCRRASALLGEGR